MSIIKMNILNWLILYILKTFYWEGLLPLNSEDFWLSNASHTTCLFLHIYIYVCVCGGVGGGGGKYICM